MDVYSRECMNQRKAPMRAIALLSQKGGSGKTTLAVHIAVAAEEAGERVVLIDTDPQGSARAWSQVRTKEAPAVEKVTASGIKRLMEQILRGRTTLTVIDTAPHATPGVDTIASMADFLLIPCRPSAFDLAAIESSVQIAKAVERPAAFVLNACPARAPEVAEARDVLESYAFPVAPVLIGHRTAFSRAVASGRSVTEFEAEGKAAEEIVQLWKWIRQQIGEKHGS
jgi:chromosome partitioning protein